MAQWQCQYAHMCGPVWMVVATSMVSMEFLSWCVYMICFIGICCTHPFCHSEGHSCVRLTSTYLILSHSPINRCNFGHIERINVFKIVYLDFIFLSCASPMSNAPSIRVVCHFPQNWPTPKFPPTECCLARTVSRLEDQSHPSPHLVARRRQIQPTGNKKKKKKQQQQATKLKPEEEEEATLVRTQEKPEIVQ